MLRGVSTLPTLFPNEAPKEIPHSPCSFGMTFAPGMSLRAALLRGVSRLPTLFPDEALVEIPHSQGSFGMTFAPGMSLRAALLRGVSTLLTSFPNEAPEEIPHSQGSLGMILTCNCHSGQLTVSQNKITSTSTPVSRPVASGGMRTRPSARTRVKIRFERP